MNIVQPFRVELDEGLHEKGQAFCEIVVTVFISCSGIIEPCAACHQNK